MTDLPEPVAISGKTRWVGLLGHPVSHSFSPAMHNAAFSALGLDIRYGAFDVEKANLKEALHGMKALGFIGCNVTVPHKETVISCLDELDPMAGQIGAVNTIIFNRQNHSSKGYNTDSLGFIRGLEEAGYSVKGQSATIFGAGGAARAIAFGLAHRGCRKIHLVNRTLTKAISLAEDLVQSQNLSVTVSQWEEKLVTQALRESQLLVNTTSLGMNKKSEEDGAFPLGLNRLLNSELFVSDIVYNPPITPLLSIAREVGCKTQNGLPMLLYQGVEAFRIWTGQEPPKTIMEKALQKSLGVSKL